MYPGLWKAPSASAWQYQSRPVAATGGGKISGEECSESGATSAQSEERGGILPSYLCRIGFTTEAIEF